MEQVKRITLPNGLTLIEAPQKAQSMTLLILVKVGSRYEPVKLTGASHFIEHLMFKGTDKRPTSLDISKELDRYGAEFNAYTGKDLTGYYIKMDASHTDEAVDLLHDMLKNSKFDPAEMNRERTVIIEEIKMYEDNPREHLSDLLESHMFYGSPLGRNIAGTRQSVAKITRRELVAYKDAYYIPSRMTVIIAGKITPGAIGLIKNTFGKLPRVKSDKDLPFACFDEPMKAKKPFALQKKATEQTQLALSFYGLPYGHHDKHIAGMLAKILGGGMSSRLFVEIREKLGLCYSIGAMHESLEDTGAFTVAAGLDHGRVKEALKAIYGQLNKIIQEPVSHDELSRAKDNSRGRLALAFEDSAVRAEWFGRQWLYERKLETPEKRIAQLQKITVGDIRRVAGLLLTPRKMILAAIGPDAIPKNFSQSIVWK
ncbi:MAG: pitrilysin family protein [Patescibacteria group bacterium]|nr:pitrilysin family protein [Patescibacteria group bacterium]